jgi:hypothetical protein
MCFTRLIPIMAFHLLSLVRPASAQTGVSARGVEMLIWAEYLGILAVGWGAGVTVWLMTGHPAVTCLFKSMPRAWKLRRKNALKSSLPIFKYLFVGGFLLVLGAILANQLWGLWMQPFGVGVLTGMIVGAGHSVANLRRHGNQIDFLEANQRYLNEDEVVLFTEHDGT